MCSSDLADSGEPAVEATEQLCQLEMACDVLPTRDTKVPCNLTVTNAAGEVEWDGPATIWVRGRSSASVAKPGYGVELTDEAGDDVGANLLGMGGEADWVIDGLYYDRLLVRDKLGYDLYRGWGGATAESALCELVRNGEYFGVHALAERVERDDDRVAIANGAKTGDAFVVTQTDEDCFYSNRTTYGCWKLVSPDEEALTPEASAAITAWFTAMDDAVLVARDEGDWDGLWSYVDEDSAIDAILLEEFFKNEDAFYTSMHAWKDAGGKLHFVPWDLDMTFGQFPGYNDYDNPEAWIQWRPDFWKVMASAPGFHERMAARWAELRADSLEESRILARIDALQAILGPAIDRNFERWPIESINYSGWFYPVSTYADEEAYVVAWIHTRLAWMDENVGEW